jgi:hypothetical protein
VTTKISAGSVIFVRSLIDANVALGSQVVKMAILSPDVLPVTADWKAASWDGDYAQILVGPGQLITLAVNRTYVVWVQITDSPETPELRAGAIATY